VSKKKRVLIILGSVFLCVVVLFVSLGIVFIDNKTVDYQVIKIEHSIVRGASLKIVHLSDLHFPRVGVDVEELLSSIEDSEPDIIAITGDIVGSNSKIESSGVFEFLEDLVMIAPVYYVTGNHEINNSEGYILYEFLKDSEVVVLQDEYVDIEINGINITIIGLIDNKNLVYKYDGEGDADYVILLDHRPRNWSASAVEQLGIAPDLVLSGHVHGGQIRMFGFGLLCPDTLLFPKYQTGLYTFENTNMVVSRGIGNSIVPFRFNNKPHVPIIEVGF
jgi:hypothetical protein